jgi:uncharacterized protein (TIGR00725 family)
MNQQKITISVIGAHQADAVLEKKAYDVGALVAKAGAVLVCGGLKGVMQAACRGAKEAGGLTIGLLPGIDKADANPFVDIALPTSLGYARNACVACSADIIIALPGSYGTTCEICYGLVYKRPVIDLGNWNIQGMIAVRDMAEAEQTVCDQIEKIRNERAEIPMQAVKA